MIEDIKLYLKTDPFFGVGTIQEIDTETHKYVWGGCLVNKQTGMIDRCVNKAKTCVGDIKYVECVFGGHDSFAIYVADIFMGYITQDFKMQAGISDGSNYWLTGITTSYNILRQERECPKIFDNDFFNIPTKADRI